MLDDTSANAKLMDGYSWEPGPGHACLQENDLTHIKYICQLMTLA